MSSAMKKFLLVILAVVCMSCFTAAACSNTYYTVTFTPVAGVTYDSEIQSGYSVKKNYKVTFKLVLAEGAEGEPEVTANDEALTPDGDGVYSFKIKANTVINVTGIISPEECEITFGVEREGEDEEGNTFTYVESNEWVHFLDLDGNELEDTATMYNGETLQFRVRLSVYLAEIEYSVAAGTVILTPVDGVYTFPITGDTVFSVRGVDNPTDMFLNRGPVEGGAGTRENPFKLKTPLDLYTVADRIADPFYAGSAFYQRAYYELENDIDLQGEQLYVIGDGTVESSVFAGVFDGNGYTISNFHINDWIIEQNEYQRVYLPFVGVFGQINGSISTECGVHNLNITDFRIEANAVPHGGNMFVGGIAGYVIGGNITNCSAEGEMIVDGDSNFFAYVGGIAGAQQSYYDANSETRFYSVVQSCSTDVSISVTSGYIYAAGGITGWLFTYEANSTALILNSYSTGIVTGAWRAGGIVGTMNANSSVKNSYATGNVGAVNNIPLILGNEDMSHAYAGGIAGYSEYGSIISDSFFTGRTYAQARAGSEYSHNDGILGGTDADVPTFSWPTMIYNSYSTDETAFGDRVQSINDGFIENTLNWGEGDWLFSGNGRPALNTENAEKTFTITVALSDGTEIHTFEIVSRYMPMSYWYAIDDGLPEYVGSGSERTYGYYFDAELENRVLNGYVPTDNVTIYAEYVNYNDVVGDYYLPDGNGYFTLTGNGELLYRDGALGVNSFFYYDGEQVVLQNTFFAIINELSDEFVTVAATVEDGVLVGTIIYRDENDAEHTAPLRATRANDTFNYGTYYDENDNEYTFNADGTGFNGATNSRFTFTISGSTLTITGSQTAVTVENNNVASIGGVTVTPYDSFRGVWEKSSLPTAEFSFDGKGVWAYTVYGYNSSGERVTVSSSNGTYEISSGVATLAGESFDGVEASITDGVLKIGDDNYYTENSFIGVWVYPTSSLSLYLTLNGITADGYGTATADYRDGAAPYNLTYEATVRGDTVYLIIYRGYEEFGYLSFNAENKRLSGSIYWRQTGTIVDSAIFYKQDAVIGDWTSEELGNLRGVSLSGYGNYTGGRMYGAIMNADREIIGSYTLTDGTNSGTFTLNAVEYDLVYNEESDTITLTPEEGDEIVLERTPEENEAQ